jgi:hypothetical protein
MARFTRTAIVAGILLIFGLSSPIWADPVLSVVPTSVSGINVGGSITYDINISNVTGLIAYQFDLSFNPNIVSAVSIDEGAFLSTAGSTIFLPGTIDAIAGSVSSTADTLVGFIPGADGSGTLAVLTLMGVGAGTSSIDISNVTLLDSNFNPILPTGLNSGSVTVTSTSLPEPSSILLLLAGAGVVFLLASTRRVS